MSGLNGLGRGIDFFFSPPSFSPWFLWGRRGGEKAQLDFHQIVCDLYLGRRRKGGGEEGLGLYTPIICHIFAFIRISIHIPPKSFISVRIDHAEDKMLPAQQLK